MGFFDSIPKPPPQQPQREIRRQWQRPHHLIPATVPADIVLIRTDRVGVAVGNLRSYPNGFEFTVHVRSRTRDDSFGSDADPFHRYRIGGDDPDRDQVLRLGVQYAELWPEEPPVESQASWNSQTITASRTDQAAGK
jgi:hypothetical protein